MKSRLLTAYTSRHKRYNYSVSYRRTTHGKSFKNINLDGTRKVKIQKPKAAHATQPTGCGRARLCYCML